MAGGGKGLVHGSVRPSNVMVASGVIKLADLGLGRLARSLLFELQAHDPVALGIARGALDAFAQEPVRRVTLEEAVSLFGRHSLELRIARAAAAGATQILRASNPTIAHSSPSAPPPRALADNPPWCAAERGAGRRRGRSPARR